MKTTLFQKRMKIQIRYFLFVSKLLNKDFEEVVATFAERFAKLYDKKHFLIYY